MGVRPDTIGLALALGATGCSLLVDGYADQPPPPTCGTIARLQDDLSGAAIAPQWEVHLGGAGALPMIDTLGLRLPIAATSDSNRLHYSELRSRVAYDLSEGTVNVRVTEAAAGSRPVLAVRKSPGGVSEPGMEIRATPGGHLEAYVGIDDGSGRVIEAIPYVPSEHAVWQLRHSAGTVYFEVAPIGGAFVAFASTTDIPIPIDSVIAVVSNQARDAQPSTQDVRFSSFNPGAERPPACPVASLVDDFDDGVVDARWYNDGTSGSFIEAEGNARCTLPPGVSAGCALRSAHGFDLRDGAVVVQIAKFPDPTATVALELSQSDATFIALTQYQSELYVERFADGEVREMAVLANPAQDGQYWRVTGVDGTAVVQTSRDGVDFETGPGHTLAVDGEIDLAEVRVSLNTNASLVTAVSDIASVNLLP